MIDETFWEPIRERIRSAARELSAEDRAARAAQGPVRVIARDVTLVVEWGGKELTRVTVPEMSGRVPPSGRTAA